MTRLKSVGDTIEVRTASRIIAEVLGGQPASLARHPGHIEVRSARRQHTNVLAEAARPDPVRRRACQRLVFGRRVDLAVAIERDLIAGDLLAQDQTSTESS